MNLHPDVLALSADPNHKIGATAKAEDELHHPMLAEVSPLPRVRDALQKLRGILRRKCGSIEGLRFAIQDNDRRLADVQPQRIRSIRMKQMKESIQ